MPHSSASRILQVLFVEDNDFLREQIVELLSSEDREITPCRNAEEALGAYERRPCDVLITDISLPGMSGMDLVRQLLKRNPDLWIVISSGYPLPVSPAVLGPNVQVLPKPFEMEQVDAMLGDVRAALATPQ